MEFIKRLIAPTKDNNYFYRDNAFQKYPLPNCTAYAWGRWYELLKEKHRLSTGDAENWYAYNDGYSRGQTPKLGAVVCWAKGKVRNSKDGSGHVAIVEEIKSDGSIVIGNSAYKKTLFYLKTLKPPYIYGSAYTFLGFIYPPVEFTEPVIITKYNLTRLLKKGCRGNDVKDLQRELNKLGFKLVVDGVFGNLTFNAVKTYQKNNHLFADGKVGKNTAHKLNWLYMGK